MYTTKINARTMLILLAIGVASASCRKMRNETNPVSSNDRQFLMNASYSNADEVDAGNLASTKGMNAGVRTFGADMVTDHTLAETDLQTVADSVHVLVPDQPDSMHVAMKALLMTLSGLTFDTTYINAQIVDHQKAIALFQTEIANGENPMVIAYANKYLPKLQMHLMMADSLKNVIK